MVALAFDTLTASKALRNADVDERLAEAIVGIVQRTTEMPDISHLATKDDLAQLAAKVATRKELAEVRTDLAALAARLDLSISTNNNPMLDRMRLQGWAMMGGVAAMLAGVVALLKLT